ncbi:protein TAB2 homolog, chloroplastic-like [Humulus lupulus]|uniref:protein TAB2 homolog, chloroplastic-like n=1 Tax=Humulus lupulus TaxID=3486 RepID=UPI002B405E70|nr:protein TAB2 homolog, chloroplastic-like [Humulus lupulus]
MQEEVEIEEEEEEEDDPTVELCYLDPETNPNSLTEWELDFCSRPILDIRGKKLWELVVCDESLSLQYTKYFPNNVINSITLKDAIDGISEDLGIPLPDKIRYFRSQMQTIITKACNELGIKHVPSKRCVSLLLWLDERFETIYTRHPGYQKGAKPLLALDNPFPMELPDNLFGDRWAFVQLPLSAVREEISSLESKLVFGSSLDLDLLGIEIDDGTLIPGLVVSSSRAKPLAAFSSYKFGIPPKVADNQGLETKFFDYSMSFKMDMYYLWAIGCLARFSNILWLSEPSLTKKPGIFLCLVQQISCSLHADHSAFEPLVKQ